MKIKRWAVYDGVAKQYSPKRFIFRRNAEFHVNDLLFSHGMDCVAVGDMLTFEEIDETKVVELT
jgi:hypothetical protein